MILLTTALAGAVSISAAAVLSYSLRSAMVERMLSLSAGLLLGAALLYALPQAFESATDKRGLCATLLAGLLSFFLLEKCATLHHARRPALPTRQAGQAGWMILALVALTWLSLTVRLDMMDPSLGSIRDYTPGTWFSLLP